MTREERSTLVQYILDHPELGYIQIGLRFQLASNTVYRIAAESGISRPSGRKNPASKAMAAVIPAEGEVR